MISQAVMPAFGITGLATFGWRGLHETSVNLTMIIVAIHVALHWDWIKNTFLRIFGKKPASIENRN